MCKANKNALITTKMARAMPPAMPFIGRHTQVLSSDGRTCPQKHVVSKSRAPGYFTRPLPCAAVGVHICAKRVRYRGGLLVTQPRFNSVSCPMLSYWAARGDPCPRAPPATQKRGRARPWPDERHLTALAAPASVAAQAAEGAHRYRPAAEAWACWGGPSGAVRT